MQTQKSLLAGSDNADRGPESLDVVVPYTTKALTQAVLDAANGLGAGLNLAIRLVWVQSVPWPLDLKQTPIAVDFMKSELAGFCSRAEPAVEIRLARATLAGLTGTLRRDSVTVIAYHRHAWQTTQQKLAAALRKAGFHVFLVAVANKEPAPHA